MALKKVISGSFIGTPTTLEDFANGHLIKGEISGASNLTHREK